LLPNEKRRKGTLFRRNRVAIFKVYEYEDRF